MLTKLAHNMRRADVGLGRSPIVLEGEEGDHFYVILRGLARGQQPGRPRAATHASAGRLLRRGRAAMHMPRTASVTALMPTTLASCDKETFDEYVRPLFADDDPSEGLRLGRSFADGDEADRPCLPPQNSCLPRPLRPCRGRAAALACRFRPAPGRGRRSSRRRALHGAVHFLTHPKRDRLVGPKPVDDDEHPIAPIDAWGHDHLWWLDRMVRSNRPLVERMTLVWHDWFATSNDGVGSQRLMLQQNDLFRSRRTRLVLATAARGHERPGDAALAVRHRQREGRAERELRARDDGALHARREPRLHRSGTCASRLAR